MSNLYPIATIVLTKLLSQLPEGFLADAKIETLKIGAEKAIVKINGIDHIKLLNQIVESLGVETNGISDVQDVYVGSEMNHVTFLYDELYVSEENEIEYSIKLEESDLSIYDKIINSYIQKKITLLKDNEVDAIKSIDGITFGVVGDIQEAIINTRINHFVDSPYYEEIYDEKGEVEINVNGLIEKFTKTGDNKATISIIF